MLFQSTFPRGERRSLLRDPLDSMHFNPRSHVGNERPLSLSCVTSTSLFQSTFPRGERPVCHYRLYLCCNFNPRSHVGNDWTGADLYRYIIISIHVPTWGTTVAYRWFNPQTKISIHVPTWGTTVVRICGYDRILISIHVPTWGTTPLWALFSPFAKISIHVPTWGTTKLIVQTDSAVHISIHVPTWGTTFRHVRRGRVRPYFNPRSHVGNDECHSPHMFCFMYFNPRSHVGNDRLGYTGYVVLNKFQSTFPRGERQICGNAV